MGPSNKVTHFVSIGWNFPSSQTAKLNKDGCSKGNHILGSRVEGLIIYENGQWIIGFSLNLGWTNIITFELWTIRYGLILAWEKGF